MGISTALNSPPGRPVPPRAESRPFWSQPIEDLLSALDVRETGLSAAEAGRRLVRGGPNSLVADSRNRVLWLLMRQFGSPIVLLLIGAAALSLMLHDRADGAIILSMIAASGMLGLFQEYNAANIVAALLSKVELKASVDKGRRPGGDPGA